jgi:hypothetical protein
VEYGVVFEAQPTDGAEQTAMIVEDQDSTRVHVNFSCRRCSKRRPSVGCSIAKDGCATSRSGFRRSAVAADRTSSSCGSSMELGDESFDLMHGASGDEDTTVWRFGGDLDAAVLVDREVDDVGAAVEVVPGPLNHR